MTPASPSPHHRLVAAGIAAILVLLACSSLVAQELPFHRDHLGSGPYRCPEFERPSAVSSEALAQGAELSSSGERAVILGDLPRAAALFARGAELNPASAALAYRRARVFEDLGQEREAIAEYCRALSLSPDGEGEGWRIRLDAVVSAERAALPPGVITAFQAGLSSADAGHLAAARISFTRAAALAPEWASAEYNRGVVLARLGNPAEAAVSLLRYLELRPGAPDAIAVARRIGQLQGLAGPQRSSPVVAGAVGTLVPGMGQFYTGRPVAGVTVLLLAGGAAAAGLFIKEVDVRCLTSVPDGASCPEGQIVSRRTDRPYLYLGIGTAAGVGIIAAAEAFFEARRRSASGSRSPGDGSASVAGETGTPSFEGPSVDARAGRIEVSLLRVRFR